MDDFKKLLTVRFLFTAAVQMQAIMLGWQMYDLTHDPLHLGLIGLAEAVPALSLALYAGYLVDRGHPLDIYRRVMGVSLLSGLIFLTSQLPWLQLTDSVRVMALYGSSVMTGLARAFSQPAIYATVPKLLPRSMLPRASAWMASTMQVARIGGPALGGLMFGWLGVVTSASVVCAVLLLAVLGSFRVQRFVATPAAAVHASVWNELMAGARFVFGHPILLPALSLDMLSVLFGGVTALLPIFASEILMVGPKGLGLLRAAPAIGAAITSAYLTRVDIGKYAGPALLSAVTGFGICILIFGCSQNLLLSLGALAMSGAFDSVSMIVRGAAVQLASPDALRGRISAVNAIFIGSSNELGEFESGLAASIFGTVATVLGGGVICLLTVTLVTILSPQLRSLRLEQQSV